MTHLRNWATSIGFLSLMAIPLSGAAQSISLTQSPSGHIIVNVAAYLPIACLSRPTYSLPAPPGQFGVYTDIACGPPPTLLPYAASVDLGLIRDGDYTVIWTFLAGGFGPVGNPVIQAFSIRNGSLPGAASGIPSLSDFALLVLAMLIGLAALVHLRTPSHGSVRWLRK